MAAIRAPRRQGAPRRNPVRAGAAEAIFRNYRGDLAECAQSNLFIVCQGVVKTPPLDAGLLAGITRAFTIEVGAGIGIACQETPLQDRDLFEADEAFFTHARFHAALFQVLRGLFVRRQ